MKMKGFIVASYGEDGSGVHLNKDEVMQMVNMGIDIKSLANGSRVVILSSPSPLASNSVEMINNKLDAFVEEHEVLLPANGRPVNMPGILALIKKKNDEADFIVIVVDHECTSMIPAFFASEKLKREIFFSGLKKGRCCLVDPFSGDITRIGKKCEVLRVTGLDVV